MLGCRSEHPPALTRDGTQVRVKDHNACEFARESTDDPQAIARQFIRRGEARRRAGINLKEEIDRTIKVLGICSSE